MQIFEMLSQEKVRPALVGAQDFTHHLRHGHLFSTQFLLCLLRTKQALSQLIGKLYGRFVRGFGQSLHGFGDVKLQ